jgi:hypothetical protein
MATVKSPLFVSLNGPRMSLYSRKQYGSIYVLNVIDYSYDPDNETDKVLYNRNDPDTHDGM